MTDYSNRLKLSTPVAGQCNWHIDWERNQLLKDTVAGQLMAGNYVVSGGVLSGWSGLNFNVSAIVCVIAGVEYQISASAQVATAGTATEDQMNWVYVDNTGSLQVSTTPPSTDDYAMIAMADVDETTVVRTADLRQDSLAGDLPSVENRCINGRFTEWQRGTSQTSSGYGSDDMWKNNHSGSTKTHTQQVFTPGQTAVPDNPEFYSRTVVTSVAGSANYVRKQYHSLDVAEFSSSRLVVPFYAKADAAKNIAVEGVQNFGSGGSAAVTGLSAQKVALTTSWAKYVVYIDFPSITGKTVGDLSYSGVVFWFDAGSDHNVRTDTLGQQSGTFDIANAKMYLGTKELPVRVPTDQQTKTACLQYFRDGRFAFVVGQASATTTARTAPVEFNQAMVGTPAISTTILSSMDANITAITPTNVRDNGFQPRLDGSGLTIHNNVIVSFDWEAAVEL